jgi:hypothetical protein
MKKPGKEPHTRIKAQIDELMAAGKQREAAQALLALIAVEPDCHPAYQKLGVAFLRLEEFRSAERYFLEAARRMPSGSDAFDGLAETYGNLGDAEQARQAGRRALVLKDASIPLILRPQRSMPRGPAAHGLIAFSLFGAHPRYCETAILNAAAIPGLLPGWVGRFYADATVPPMVVDRLRTLGAQVIMVEGVHLRLPGTMWRFLALDDPEADAVICRDADSLLNARDAGWIGTWMCSGLPFHIVRDYFSHCELMLAGLFGVRGGVLADIGDTMRQWLSRNTPATRWTDQYFLRSCIWPLARDASLTHDTWFAYGSFVMPDTQSVADQRDHVGANHGTTTMELKLDQPDGSAVRWALVDTGGVQVSCSYTGEVRDRRHVVQIPRSHGDRIHSGEWKVQWVVTPAEKHT